MLNNEDGWMDERIIIICIALTFVIGLIARLVYYQP